MSARAKEQDSVVVGGGQDCPPLIAHFSERQENGRSKCNDARYPVDLRYRYKNQSSGTEHPGDDMFDQRIG